MVRSRKSQDTRLCFGGEYSLGQQFPARNIHMAQYTGLSRESSRWHTGREPALDHVWERSETVSPLNPYNSIFSQTIRKLQVLHNARSSGMADRFGFSTIPRLSWEHSLLERVLH